MQSLGLGVELTREGGFPGAGEEVDAEQLIASRLDDEITEMGTEKMLQGDAVVADMPLVNLASDAGEDEFEVLHDNNEDEEVMETADPDDAEVTELKG